MNNDQLRVLSVCMLLGFGAVACGDDDTEEKKVDVDVPGVDVTVDELTAPAAGHAANTGTN